MPDEALARGWWWWKALSGYGLALARVLLTAGERVVDVAPALIA